MDTPSKTSLLFVISGPAGSGKTTLCDRFLENLPALRRVVTSTSRPPRGAEVDGVDYHFFTPEEFSQKISEGAFYEHAHVHGNHYGILKSEILEKLASGSDLLLNIDVQGASTMRRAAREDSVLRGRLVTVFLAPAEFSELEQRLRGRGTDSEESIARRLENARREMAERRHYDYFIPSASRDEDFNALAAIHRAEKLRVRETATAE